MTIVPHAENVTSFFESSIYFPLFCSQLRIKSDHNYTMNNLHYSSKTLQYALYRIRIRSKFIIY